MDKLFGTGMTDEGWWMQLQAPLTAPVLGGSPVDCSSAAWLSDKDDKRSRRRG